MHYCSKPVEQYAESLSPQLSLQIDSYPLGLLGNDHLQSLLCLPSTKSANKLSCCLFLYTYIACILRDLSKLIVFKIKKEKKKDWMQVRGWELKRSSKKKKKEKKDRIDQKLNNSKNNNLTNRQRGPPAGSQHQSWAAIHVSIHGFKHKWMLYVSMCWSCGWDVTSRQTQWRNLEVI